MQENLAAKTRRRWLQFSLRTWLIVMVGLSICGGWWTERAFRQKEAVERLQFAGIDVECDSGVAYSIADRLFPKAAQAMVDKSFFWSACDVHVWATNRESSNVPTKHVNLSDTVRCLPNLRRLCLDGVVVADDDLKVVSQIATLQVLFVGGPQITDRGIRHLIRLGKLEKLALSGCRITEQGIQSITRMPNLTSLGLGDIDLSSQSLAAICNMVRLKRLTLDGSRTFDDDDLAKLAHLKNLTDLSISIGNITDAGLRRLKGLESLKAAYLYYDERFSPPDADSNRVAERHSGITMKFLPERPLSVENSFEYWAD